MNFSLCLLHIDRVICEGMGGFGFLYGTPESGLLWRRWRRSCCGGNGRKNPAYLALGLAGLDVGAFLLGWAVRWNCFIAPSIYHPSHPLESIRPKKSFPNPISSKGPRIKRGLISYSTLPHVPSIARLLSAINEIKRMTATCRKIVLHPIGEVPEENHLERCIAAFIDVASHVPFVRHSSGCIIEASYHLLVVSEFLVAGKDMNAAQTQDSFIMKPIDQRERTRSRNDVLTRRLKNRERQRRYRARKRLEADMKKPSIIKQSPPPQVEVQMNGFVSNYVPRVHCKRDWKKDARRARVSEYPESYT
ncbi:hypothetical protein Prudu_013595 [Prunus dulcis]|uniref:Uncharacterized protein n=1 Tax=Prunus dulcis TaxID=3755 RepID=A0A4Y1RG65_PRUDU|nr:hypothetical protein Prudu_013595 [Prunus dulcis]